MFLAFTDARVIEIGTQLTIHLTLLRLSGWLAVLATLAGLTFTRATIVGLSRLACFRFKEILTIGNEI